MYIEVDQIISKDGQITEDELNTFVDAFIDLVDSFGWVTGGSFRIRDDDWEGD